MKKGSSTWGRAAWAIGAQLHARVARAPASGAALTVRCPLIT
jgi:hypothetical protein